MSRLKNKLNFSIEIWKVLMISALLFLLPFLLVFITISYYNYRLKLYNAPMNTPNPIAAIQSPTPTITPTVPSDTPNPSPTTSQKPASTQKTVNMYVTFYGWPDNDPAGKDIAYPKKHYPEAYHNQTGGIGTYDDPLTMATDPDEFAIGTILYVPFLKKYVVMEDWCSTCVTNWQGQKKYHIDIWMESDENFKTELLKCQSFWTKRSTPIELNPPSDRPVSTTPLFNIQNGKCTSKI